MGLKDHAVGSLAEQARLCVCVYVSLRCFDHDDGDDHNDGDKDIDCDYSQGKCKVVCMGRFLAVWSEREPSSSVGSYRPRGTHPSAGTRGRVVKSWRCRRHLIVENFPDSGILLITERQGEDLGAPCDTDQRLIVS